MSAKVIQILKDEPFLSGKMPLAEGCFLTSVKPGDFDASELRRSSAIVSCSFLLKTPVVSSSMLSEGDILLFPDIFDLDFFYMDTLQSLVSMQFNPAVYSEVKRLSKQFNFALVR